MSNSVGHGFLRPTFLEHQIKTNSNGIGGNTLFQPQANSQIRKFSSSSSSSPSLLPSDFRGQRLTVRKLTLPRNRVVSGFAQAVLTTDAASEVFCSNYILYSFSLRIYEYLIRPFRNL